MVFSLNDLELAVEQNLPGTVDGSELDVENARLDQRRQTRCVLVDKTF
jgi:hypothetical protein